MKFLIIIMVMILTCCRSGKKDQNIVAAEVTTVPDSTCIFNGTSLDGWEITNFGPQGPVDISGGSVFLGMGDGCTGITYRKPFPETDYEVTLEAKRVSGTDFFCGMTFPAGREPCSLIIGGWGGTIVGLSSIDGRDASENETTKHMRFESGKWYRIRLRVTDEEINAWIDDEPVVHLIRKGKKLTIRPEVNLSRPFGIASWNTTAALRNIRVVRLAEATK